MEAYLYKHFLQPQPWHATTLEARKQVSSLASSARATL